MRRIIVLISILTCTAILAGCMSQQVSKVGPSTPGAPVPPADDRAAVAAIPRISVSETEALVKSGAAILLDVRPEPAFRSERIKGAISMPPAQITARYKSLPADKKIITYCA